MQALLLNSGLGSRMEELTRSKPKCLLEIAPGETVISRQIKALLALGIEDIVITTGPFAGMLEQYLETVFQGQSFTYVHNPRYAETNYIYSLLLAKNSISRNLILLHGDLVFDRKLLEETLNCSQADTVLINPQAPLPAKDFKGRLAGGLVREISVNIFGEDCRLLFPLYKISFSLWELWQAEMACFAARGELNVYAEEALNRILPRRGLYPVVYSEEFCREIDDPADLEAVRRALAGGAGGA
ncbi:MAG: phosphocholine cytidylyltransferase family protein [Bacillota bacterium]|nr:phosphocholine cytidylyltransferase family protein [Bacillota bacterium]HHU29373.1 phosphocholine cytidylyltransferase family protein [Bacillota bacterium]